MTRGDLIIASLAGDFGKPRPCLIVQSDRLARLNSVLVCPLTSRVDTAGPTRIVIKADISTGLEVTSLVMVDKVTALSRSRCREVIGTVDTSIQERIDGILMFVVGLLD